MSPILTKDEYDPEEQLEMSHWSFNLETEAGRKAALYEIPPLNKLEI